MKCLLSCRANPPERGVGARRRRTFQTIHLFVVDPKGIFPPYYPTALRRIQITPKKSAICTPGDRLDRFSRNAQATNWIEVTKKCLLVKTNFFFTFLLNRNLKVKNLN